MRHAEEKVRAEEERRSRHPEKYERKNAERLERAKKRCEQIRQIIGSLDPANLSHASASTSNCTASNSAESSVPPTVDPSLALWSPSAETIRLLSNAIAGCLQPCNLINKILNDIEKYVAPHPSEDVSAPPPTPATAGTDQQQQTEFPRQNSATNTSNMSTPAIPAHSSSQEIEALFKEAAKELEKMNEIVNNNKSLMGSSGSLVSTASAFTQVEQSSAFTDSTHSEATVINMPSAEVAASVDSIDNARAPSPNDEFDFKILTPPKREMRSRESSIEVHDVNSMMSDDSRDWTMLDHITNEEGDVSYAETDPFISSTSNAAQKGVPTELASASSDSKNTSLKSVTAETQTPTSLLSNASVGMTREEVRSSIQKSIETVGELSDMVKNSVALAQQSLQSVQQPPAPHVAAPEMQPILRLRRCDDTATVEAPIASAPAPPKQVRIDTSELNNFIRKEADSISPPTPKIEVPRSGAADVRRDPRIELIFRPNEAPAPQQPQVAPVVAPRQPPVLGTLSALTQANLAANRLSTGARPKTVAAGPAVVVYDPNPKINSSVHQMMGMGFSNEGECNNCDD